MKKQKQKTEAGGKGAPSYEPLLLVVLYAFAFFLCLVPATLLPLV